MTDRFVDIRKFTQRYLWIFLLGLAGIPAYGFFQQLILDDPFGNQPISDVGLQVPEISNGKKSRGFNPIDIYETI